MASSLASKVLILTFSYRPYGSSPKVVPFPALYCPYIAAELGEALAKPPNPLISLWVYGKTDALLLLDAPPIYSRRLCIRGRQIHMKGGFLN